MENKIALLDSSILIDHFRRKDKTNSLLMNLTHHFDKLCISSITEFEIYVGAPEQQKAYWEHILLKMRRCLSKINPLMLPSPSITS